MKWCKPQEISLTTDKKPFKMLNSLDYFLLWICKKINEKINGWHKSGWSFYECTSIFYLSWSYYLALSRQIFLWNVTTSKMQLKTTHSYIFFAFFFFVSLLTAWARLLSSKLQLSSIPASFAISSISFSLKYQKQKEYNFCSSNKNLFCWQVSKM